ncbi:MAG: M36 family metallopeptidase [Verrucomicrobiaceae bacterium]|nr:M36 family metallopeptidase [Verrucomicrobiaceae bacterium]
MKVRHSFSLPFPLLAALLMFIGMMAFLLMPTSEVSNEKVTAEKVSVGAQPKTRLIMDRVKKRVKEVDQREKGGGASDSSRRREDLAKLQRAFPGIQVDFDPVSGAPKHILAAGKFLSRAEQGSQDPHEPVRQFIEAYPGLFGHRAVELKKGHSRVTREDVTAHNGMRTVVWQQEVAGVPVFQTILKANLTKNGELVTLGSHFMADAPKAAAEQVALVTNPPLNAPKALAEVAQSLGGTLEVAKVTPKAPAQGVEQSQKLAAPGFSDTTAHLSWVPMDEKTLRLAWEIETFSLAANEMFRVLVDAKSGEVLVRQSLTNDISNATYRVFTSDSPSPFSPGHSTPSTVQPAEVARTLLTTQAHNTTASPEGWIPDGQNETLGNNVDAHLDLDANNVADTPRPQGVDRVFDFTWDLTAAPSTYRDASVTQLFYYNNWIHDRFYELGFTESAGNFQTNNFGRGGNGNDAVQADSQDGSGTNNANMSTPSDGSPARMQMFIFPDATPDRDSSFDGEIVIHEYTHGLSNRLVGGGVGLGSLQGWGMGEGWSDFYAISLLSQAGDDLDGCWAKGGYATKDFYGLTQNYYFGIRRYPYCQDMTKNPLTYKDIDPSKASSHAGVPLNPLWSSSNSDPSEVHGQGEVWCMALLECRRNIILNRGWATGNELMLQIVTDGMKLAPANPTFLQARDAILQADLVNNAGANRIALWSGFAKRGMGSNAISPSTNTTTGVTESFDLPDDLSVTPVAAFLASGDAGGPFAPAAQAYTVSNTGTAPLSWTAASNQTWITVAPASGTLAAGASTTVTATISAAADALADGLYSATLTFTNTTSTAVLPRQASLRIGVVDYFTEVFDSSGPQDIDNQSFLFTPNASASGYVVQRVPVTAFPTDPAGGASLPMSDDTYASVSLTGGNQVKLHGTSYNGFFVGSNGYVTFGNGDSNYSISTGTHFSLPRISGMLLDLYPSTGLVTWRELADRAAVTWLNVPPYGGGNLSNFQIEMFFDGRIRITHLDVGVTSGVIGLSRGTGVPADFVESNFSGYQNILPLTLSFAANAAESAGGLTGTLQTSGTVAADTTVSLASSNTAEVTVPASVTILAGQSSVSFTLNVVNDTLLDGTQSAQITATASGFTTANRTISIMDDETTTLTLTAPATLAEGAAATTGSVSIPAAAGRDVQVSLLSNDTGEIIVPEFITIPAGQSQASFTLNAPQDTLLDGTQNVTLTASVANWTSGTAGVAVTDDETATITLNMNDETYEGAPTTPAPGVVTLGGVAVTPVTVSLTSSHPAQLTVPASITIAAGQSTAAVPAAVVDDTALDGTANVTVSASAFGGTALTDVIAVRDNDAASFVIGSIASPQIEGANIPLTITAKDVNGATLPAVAGPVTQAAAGDAGALAYSYPTAAEFVNGVWQQNVRVLAAGTNVRITVTGPQATAASNPFAVLTGPRIGVAPASFTLDIPRQSSKTRTVTLTNTGLGAMNWNAASTQTWLTASPASGSVPAGASAEVTVTFNATTLPLGAATAQLTFTSNDLTNPSVAVPVTLNVTGPVASFAWDIVPSPQRVNAPVAVTVTAKDAGGATVTGFEGTVGLEAFTGTAGSPTVQVASFIGYADIAGEYLNTKAAISRYFTNYTETSFTGTTSADLTAALAGKQVLLIPEQENATSNTTFSSLGTQWSDALNQFVNQGGMIIVCSNHLDESLILSSTGLLSVTKVSSPQTASLELAGTTFLNTGIVPPITSEWLSTYQTSTNGTVSIREVGTNYPVVLHRQVGAGRVVLIGTDYYTPNTSMDRVIANAVAAAGPQNTPRLLTPTQSAAFVNGVWNGSVTPGEVFTNGWFRAQSGGILGESNTFDVVTDGTLGITLAASAAENAGTLAGTVTVTPAPAADVVVAVSSSVAGAATPATATVTVPSGSTSAAFTLNITNDTLLDGGQVTQIGAVAAGFPAVNVPLTVDDDETAVLTLSLTATTAAEGDGTLSATLTSSAAPVVPVTVSLSSSDTSEATLPASVTLPAGATTASFTVTVVDDTLVDGTRSTDLTATVPGWTAGMVTLTVTDNELKKLNFSGMPTSLAEGAVTLTTPRVTLTGQAVSAVVVTLTSSDETAIPSQTVTIPAGASFAAFDLDPVDDLLFDGTQPVTLTATALSFISETAAVTVLDDDVHHFALSSVTGPVREGAAIPFTATAKDVNDVTITTEVGGPVNLTAAGDGGTLSVLPATPLSFTAGVWTGNVRVMAPGVNVRLTVASPTATNQSNAFDVTAGPRLSVNPTSLAMSVAQNFSKTRPLALNNTGTEPLTWSASTLGTINPPLEDVLAGINARHAEITALVPNRFNFTEGETGTSIYDGGGSHMYHGGNSLSTSLAPTSYLNYSNNVIATSASFGTGGRYFTRKVPGLFVMAADMSGVPEFIISGGTGNHFGIVEGSVLTAVRGSRTFKGFVKRARGDTSYNAESVNHLIIIENDAAAAQSFSSTVDSDDHHVTGLGARTRMYYLLYSAVNGGDVDDAATQAIFEKFLDVAGSGSWITVSPASGTIPAGGSQSVAVTFIAGGLAAGAYTDTISLTSNDALTSPLAVPATMTVTPGVHHLEWDALPTPQVVNTPVSATIRAKDASGATVTDFEGTAALSAFQIAASEGATGTGTSSTWYIHDTSYAIHRTQCIYTPAEVGQAARLSGLAFDVATLGSPAASQFTIRLKHTGRADYSTDTSWETSGWTTVFAGSKTLTTGLNYFSFATPFDYDGSSNLMVDISFVNSSYSSASNIRYSTTTSNRTIYAGAYSGDPLNWSSSAYAYTGNALPNLRLVRSGVVAQVSPPATGSFANGVWTGNVRLGSIGSIEVTATAAANVSGKSNTVTTTSSGGSLTLTLPASMTEGQGTITNGGTLTASTAPAANVTVTLENLTPGDLSVPTTVTLPAGQTSVSFDVTPVNDTLLDGPALVTVRALAVGYPTATASNTVVDDETTTVTLTLPASMTEQSSTTVTATGTVTLATPAAGSLKLTLASSMLSRLTVPATVTIPAGQSSATFTLTLADNNIIEDNIAATITATLAGSTPGTGTLQVLDNESRQIWLQLYYYSLSEGAAPVVSGGYVYLSGSVANALMINLSSSDTTELTVPATVTIPAGSSQSGFFTLTPVNDTLQDGMQNVTVSAAAATFTTGTSSIQILDDDLHHFAVSAVPASQVRGAPFNVTFTAQDINNSTISTYAGTPALTAASGGTVLSVTPTSLSGFSSGQKTQSVTVNTLASAAVLTLTDAASGSTGSSNAFSVGAGALHHFTWGNVPSPQTVSVPFAASLSARDAYENTVTSFAGTASLDAVYPSTPVTIGAGTSTSGKPLDTSYDGARSQMIFIPSEIGGSRLLTGISLNITTPPALPLTRFGIRLKHTATGSYPSSTSFDNTSLITVYQRSSESITATGWREFVFDTPFAYNGVQNLLVDMVFDNAGSSTAGICQSTLVSPSRHMAAANLKAWGYGDPYNWGYANNFTQSSMPNVRFSTGLPIAISPSSSVSFSGGAWSGQVAVNASGTGIRLRASSGVVGGMSSMFNAVALGALTLNHAASVTEGGAALTATLSIATAPVTDLIVALNSSNTAAATVPATATIVAGQTSTTFPVSIVNDTLLDGTQTSTLTASASGYDSGVSTLSVVDDETTTISLTLPAMLAENAAAATGTVTLGAAAGANITLPLTSSDSTELLVPSTVTIPSGSTSATFAITPVDDALIDFAQSVTVSTSMAGWTGGSASISITDNETATLGLSFTSSVAEGSGTLSATITASNPVQNATTVTLTSTDTTEATVPATATIPAGASSMTFTITILDDTIKDGSQSLTISAASAGFTTGTRALTVTDNDVANFLLSSIGSPQVRNQPFNVTFTARDINNATITNYSGTPALTGLDGITALTVTPTSVGSFSNGSRTVAVTVGSFATNAVLTLTDAAAVASGSSNAFAVGTGTASQFVWSTITSPQTSGTAFPVTITAKDVAGNTATDFTSVANLAVAGSGIIRDVGSNADPCWVPFNTIFSKCRTQQVHLASELGGAGTLTSLAINITVPYTVSVTDFTIRLKHTSRTGYTDASDRIWESSGFTTVYQGSPSLSTAGYATFNFTTGFAYDGVSNLMVDMSYRASSTTANRPTVAGTTRSGSTRTINYYTSSGADPLTWSGLVPAAFPDSRITDIRLGVASGTSVGLSPIVTSAFSGGVWTGNLTLAAPATNIQLQASSGSITGLSNSFNVNDIPSYTLGLTLPAAAAESAGSVSGTVTISAAQASAVTVNLSSNDTTEANPAAATVTIPAGSTSANFTLNIINDTLQDGAQTATITVSVAGVPSASTNIIVNDNDLSYFTWNTISSPRISGAPFSVTINARTVDNQPATGFTGTASLSTPAASVTPAATGAFSGGAWTGNVSVLGSGSATLTATSGSATGVSAAFILSLPVLTVTLPASVSESVGTVPGTVSISSVQSAATVINLSSSVPAQAAPAAATVTIAAGTLSAAFTLNVVNDTVKDGAQNVHISAAYTHADSGSATISIADNELHSFLVSTIPGPQVRDVPFNVTFTARAIDNATITTYTGNPALTAADGATPLTPSPASTGAFTAGTCTTAVTLGSLATNAVLTVTDAAAAASGSSNAFNIIPATIAKFHFSGLPPQVTSDQPIPITLTAQDVNGNTVASHTDPVSLKVHGTGEVGVGDTSFTPLFGTSSHDGRTQSLYTAEEIGAARSIDSIAFNVTTLPGHPLTNLTVRMKHTTLQNYASSNVSWESTGWTVCYSGTHSITATGWDSIPLTTPFPYDGRQNVLVDISFDGNAPSAAGIVQATAGTAYRTLHYLSDSADGDPLGWSGLTPLGTPSVTRPDIRFGTAQNVTLTPANTGNFTAGMWTGDLTLSGQGTGLRLEALSGSASSFSTPFDLGSAQGQASSLLISGLPTSRELISGTPYSVTISAVTPSGAADTSYSGPVDLSIRAPGSGERLVGRGTILSSTPFNGSSHDARTQTIYTAEQLGRQPQQILGLSLNLTGLSGTVFNNLTIRLRHTALTSYAAGSSWESTGWTTVHSSTFTTTGNGWHTFPFSTLFSYDGVNSLMVDISFDNTAATNIISSRHDPAEALMTVYGTDNSTLSAPITWSGTSPTPFGTMSQPQLRLLLYTNLTITPKNATLTSGAWTGNVTINGLSKDAILRAQDRPGRSGTVSSLTIQASQKPILVTEPAFTGGRTNTLTWAPSNTNVNRYEIQAATSTAFSPLAWTGNATITSTMVTTGILPEERLYYYRVRAHNNAFYTSDFWQDTDWGDFSNSTHSGTTSGSHGGSVALYSSPALSITTTENFNALTGNAWSSYFDVLGGNSGYLFTSSSLTTGPNTTPPLPINQGGDLEGRITGTYGWALAADTASNTFADGSIESYLCIETPASSTSCGLILRGGTTTSGTTTTPYGYLANISHSSPTLANISLGYLNGTVTSFPSVTVAAGDIFKLRFSAKGPNLTLNAWKVSVVAGAVSETPILTSAGNANLSFYDTRYVAGRAGLRAFVTGTAALFDDLSLTITPRNHLASGTVLSPIISPSVRQSWGTLRYTTTVPSGTTLTIDVLDATTSAVLASNVINGANLGYITAPALRLRANLSSTNPSLTPLLHDWQLSFIPQSVLAFPGAWSPVVTSTQDATPPVITVPQLTTTAATATLAGTASDATSGVVSVTAAGNAASTSNAFANWTSALTGLTDGTNSITVTAADHAVPPNTATTTVTVFRIATPGGDPESNGIDALLEHALGIPAGSANARSMLPAALTETDGGSGQKYLCMQFRRRIQRAGLNYIVETSTDLLTWDDTGASVVEKSAVPTGDGTTETVTVRVTPSSDLGGAKFVRLRVTSN